MNGGLYLICYNSLKEKKGVHHDKIKTCFMKEPVFNDRNLDLGIEEDILNRQE